MSPERPALRALAARLGVEDGYRSALDQRFVPTTDATREALAEAMGFDASSEEAAERAHLRLDEEDREAPAGPEPVSCVPFRERLGGARAFGLWTNLYSVRSERNPGFGNLSDLRALVRWSAEQGAAFVGVNPLHALNSGDAFSPYAPSSRLFRDPLYLDPAGVPELDDAPEARAALERLAGTFAALRAAPRLDPAATERTLLQVLRPLHARFRTAPTPERRARFRAFCQERGEALLSFATFRALADARTAGAGACDWRRWPREWQAPDAPAVRTFRRAHAEEVDFHAWVQFELESQLEAVGREARDAGMAVGLYTDLALGSAGGGFDTWSSPGLFARGASVGAPPDAFSRSGQDWGFPPLDPRALRRDGFAFWRRLLEANLCGAGALRIDHALGLRRLFWIPAGRPAQEGAYVRSPEAELLAVLGETSRRLGALVIGEDLGTVPERFSQEMQQRGLLSSRVLLFERDAGGFHASGSWPEACLATVNTHDLPPLAGWLAGDDLELRRATGQIPDDATREAMGEERRSDREALRRRLEAEGLLSADAPADDDAWLCATTAFLGRTPAALVGLSLDDLAGERVPINLPGVPPERHRSWVRRMESELDAILGHPRTRKALDAVPVERRGLG